MKAGPRRRPGAGRSAGTSLAPHPQAWWTTRSGSWSVSWRQSAERARCGPSLTRFPSVGTSAPRPRRHGMQAAPGPRPRAAHEGTLHYCRRLRRSTSALIWAGARRILPGTRSGPPLDGPVATPPGGPPRMDARQVPRAEPTPARVELSWLDVMKGVAIVWIALDHVAERLLGFPYIANPSRDWPPLAERVAQLRPLHGHGAWDPVLNLLRYVGWSGEQGVQLFLIASGFGLTWGLMNRYGRGSLPLADFYRRRLARLYPLMVGGPRPVRPDGAPGRLGTVAEGPRLLSESGRVSRHPAPPLLLLARLVVRRPHPPAVRRLPVAVGGAATPGSAVAAGNGLHRRSRRPGGRAGILRRLSGGLAARSGVHHAAPRVRLRHRHRSLAARGSGANGPRVAQCPLAAGRRGRVRLGHVPFPDPAGDGRRPPAPGCGGLRIPVRGAGGQPPRACPQEAASGPGWAGIRTPSIFFITR